jgi:hypothetical protein
VAAALAEIEAHLQNGTWELAQLPPGRRAIGSRWVFKIKRLPDGSIDKYKGRIVAQGFSQVQGIHYNEIFASTARMAAMRAVLAIAAAEDLELESVDISTAFLNGDIDAEVYMKVPEGLEVEGDPRPGEDPKRWVVRLLKGLYGIKQGPRIWALKLHSVLTSIGFERIDCDYSVYVYRRGDVRIMMPIHVDDLLLASNSKAAIQRVKSDLATHFKLHDQGPTTSILGIKIDRDRAARTISLSQPGYVESILEQFGMADCNPSLTPMDENQKLSARMSPDTPEGRSEMKAIPYRELIGKLLYLAIATRPDIAYVVGVLCRFVENPGPPTGMLLSGSFGTLGALRHEARLLMFFRARFIHHLLGRRSQWEPGQQSLNRWLRRLYRRRRYSVGKPAPTARVSSPALSPSTPPRRRLAARSCG